MAGVHKRQAARTNLTSQSRFAHKPCALDSTTLIRTSARASTPVKNNLDRCNHFTMTFSRSAMHQAVKATISACKKAKSGFIGRFSCCLGTKPAHQDEGGTGVPPPELLLKPEPAAVTPKGRELLYNTQIPATPLPPVPESPSEDAASSASFAFAPGPPATPLLLSLLSFEDTAHSLPLSLSPGVVAGPVATDAADVEVIIQVPLEATPEDEALVDEYLRREWDDLANPNPSLQEWQGWEDWWGHHEESCA